jgi:hypothetical protein
MPYYAFLFAAVLMVLALSWALWSYTRSIAFPFGMALFYFWSLHGAWSIVTDRLGGDSQKQYHYLFDRMFPVYLDENYAWTLGLYAAFILVVALTVLCWVRPACPSSDKPCPIVLSHDRILVMCGLAAIISVWIIHDSLDSAISSGTSGYVVSRSTLDLGWFRLHQLLNRIALIPASLGFATLMSSGGCRYFAGEVRSRHYVGYAVLLAFMYCFCVVLGNKNELALALFSACLFYLANSIRPKTRRLVAAGTMLLACVGFIDFARGFSVNEIADNVSFAEITYSLVRIADSNEAFAAHMSLYGILHYDVPLTYGSSVVSFLASAVPQSLWPDRPADIYWHYANGVAATEGQGYTVHHAAGWYLNFGVAGVFIGASLLGRIWSALYNNVVQASRQHGSSWWRIFCIVGFFTFTASLPTIIRSGPEIYKSVLVESFTIPVAILALARAPSLNRRRVHSVRPNCGVGNMQPATARTIVRSRPHLQSSRI